MSGRGTVVIVEDDFFISEANRMDCEDLDLEVVGMAEDETEAVSVILDQAPDFVILDVRLAGDGDGVRVAEQLAAEGYRGGIIFATGSCDEANMQRMERADPQAILIKPFGKAEIHSAVKQSFAARAA